MKKIVLLLVVLFYGFSLTHAQKKGDKEMIIQQIQANDRKFETFMEKGMADSIAAMFSPNCQLADEFGVLVEDKAKVKDYFVGEKKAGKKYMDYTLKPNEQKVYGAVCPHNRKGS